MLKLFVDGKLVAKSTSFDPAEYDVSTDQPLRIGFGQTDYFAGRMADVRIYNRALKDAEIQKLAAQACSRERASNRLDIMLAAQCIAESTSSPLTELQTMSGRGAGLECDISDEKPASSDEPMFLRRFDSTRDIVELAGFPTSPKRKVACARRRRSLSERRRQEPSLWSARVRAAG